MILAEVWRVWRHVDWHRVSSYAAAVLVALVIAAPWYGIVYSFTANPVFPLYNGIFNSPLWAAENTTLNASQFGIGTNVGALLRLPFRMVFNRSALVKDLLVGVQASDFTLCAFGNRYGVSRPPIAVLARDLLLALLTWALTFQYVRYYVAILPLILCLGVAACSEPLLLLFSLLLKS